MELRNEFRVDLPAATAWLLLNDVERIAPCVPGAQLQEIDGDDYRGMVKVKVGPISAQYRGKATFVEQDEGAGRLVLAASGRDSGDGGHANARITASFVPDGTGTTVTVVTDLAITGRLARLGKGVLADVSANLLGQFVSCLHETLVAGAAPSPVGAGLDVGPRLEGAASNGSSPAEDPAVSGEDPAAAEVPEAWAGGPAVPGDEPAAGGVAEAVGGRAAVRRVEGPDVAPVDLFDAAGRPLAKRAVPAVAGVAFLITAVWWWRRRSRQ